MSYLLHLLVFAAGLVGGWLAYSRFGIKAVAVADMLKAAGAKDIEALKALTKKL